MHLQVRRRNIQKSFFLTYWTLFEPGALHTEPFCTAPHRCRLVRCVVRRLYQTGPTVRCVVQQKGPLNRTALNPGITSPCAQKACDIPWPTCCEGTFISCLPWTMCSKGT